MKKDLTKKEGMGSRGKVLPRLGRQASSFDVLCYVSELTLSTDNMVGMLISG